MSNPNPNTTMKDQRQGYPPTSSCCKPKHVTVMSTEKETFQGSMDLLIPSSSGFRTPLGWGSPMSPFDSPPQQTLTDSSSGSSLHSLDYSIDSLDCFDDTSNHLPSPHLDNDVGTTTLRPRNFVVPLHRQTPPSGSFSYLPSVLRSKPQRVSFSTVDELCDEDTEMDRIALRARSPKLQWYPSSTKGRKHTKTTCSTSSKSNFDLLSPKVVWYPSSSKKSPIKGDSERREARPTSNANSLLDEP